MTLTVKKKTAEKSVAKTVTATAVVNKTQPDGSESSETIDLGHELIAGEAVKIEVAVGLTRNLGNYESLKFHVGITMPCHDDEASIEEAYVSSKDWVDAKVNEINAEVDTMLGSKG